MTALARTVSPLLQDVFDTLPENRTPEDVQRLLPLISKVGTRGWAGLGGMGRPGWTGVVGHKSRGTQAGRRPWVVATLGVEFNRVRGGGLPRPSVPQDQLPQCLLRCSPQPGPHPQPAQPGCPSPLFPLGPHRSRCTGRCTSRCGSSWRAMCSWPCCATRCGRAAC